MKIQLKYLLLFALVICLFTADIIVGSVKIPLSHLFDNDGIYHEIIYNFRLPKAITAILTGSAISIAGLIMQTLFQNPFRMENPSSHQISFLQKY